MRLLKRPLREAEISAAIRGALVPLAYVHSLDRVDGVITIIASDILVASDGQVKLHFSLTIQFLERLASLGFSPPYWAAPEVIASGRACDARADMWSLGITVVELLVGQPPPADLPLRSCGLLTAPPSEPPEQSSDLFEDFVRRMLVKDPAERGGRRPPS
jgi:serine/threonine protein kinase